MLRTASSPERARLSRGPSASERMARILKSRSSPQEVLQPCPEGRSDGASAHAGGLALETGTAKRQGAPLDDKVTGG